MVRDPGRSVGTNLDHVLDRLGVDRSRLRLLTGQPKGGVANEIGSETGEVFLQLQRLRSANLQMVHLEDGFAFFDASFDGLTTIVRMKPGRKVAGHIIVTIVQEHRMATCIAKLVVSQGDVERIGEIVELLQNKARWLYWSDAQV